MKTISDYTFGKCKTCGIDRGSLKIKKDILLEASKSIVASYSLFQEGDDINNILGNIGLIKLAIAQAEGE